jgi:carbonic anhydrase
MKFIETLISRNASYAARAHAPRPPRPTGNTIVVSCLDARTDPAHFLGIEPGEALVVRNAGGRVTDAVERELGMILALVAKSTGQAQKPQLVLVHHTSCGMERLTDAKLAAAVSDASGVEVDAIARLAIGDHHQSLKTDLQRLQTSRHVPRGLSVSGLRYDEASGRATVVFEATT